MIQKDKASLQNIAASLQYEWLETNGLGGWAGASVTGALTRRYHGLLVAAVEPPARRMALVSKLDETIVSGGHRYELGTNVFQQEAIYPAGYACLSQFTKDLLPEWQYELPGITLAKTIAMVQGENTTVVLYHVLQAAQPFTLELQPFLSVRDYHALVHENNAVNRDASFANGVFYIKAYEGTPGIHIRIPGSRYEAHPDWYRNFYYLKEKARGLDFEEDLFSHGHFSIEAKHNDIIGVVISTDEPGQKDAQQLYAAEKSRKQRLREGQPGDELSQQLLLAADQFVVQKSGDLKTVIAGYHWFTDWTRDTMIALQGLCLCTKRFADAARILEAFSRHVSEGMLPNRFMDNGQAPEYNTVDGTLWFFIAVYKYWLATGDKVFVLQKMLPVLKDIIDWHRKGTRYHIHEDEDGLLYAGEPGVQLTWMDAKVGDRVITPRTGKAVEVQALWYNALRIYAVLLALNEKADAAQAVEERAKGVKKQFRRQFVNKAGGWLYDVIDGANKDASLRPNQLLAISLPYPLIKGKHAEAVFGAVKKKLYTPVGLRSLSPDDPAYRGECEGDVWSRDNAYHQGTVWSWLLGPYVDAVMRVKGAGGKPGAKKIIKAFRYHLEEACIGDVSEIFDGNAPHLPGGCVAQAWGVAEMIRVIKEYGLSGSSKVRSSKVRSSEFKSSEFKKFGVRSPEV